MRRRSFNSRARKGRDTDANLTVADLMVSIHAPARGATGIRLREYGGSRFQFTRPQGARLSHKRGTGERLGFSSRARKGSDTGALG